MCRRARSRPDPVTPSTPILLSAFRGTHPAKDSVDLFVLIHPKRARQSLDLRLEPCIPVKDDLFSDAVGTIDTMQMTANAQLLHADVTIVASVESCRDGFGTKRRPGSGAALAGGYAG